MLKRRTPGFDGRSRRDRKRASMFLFSLPSQTSLTANSTIIRSTSSRNLVLQQLAKKSLPTALIAPSSTSTSAPYSLKSIPSCASNFVA